jgi:hypothetical protein
MYDRLLFLTIQNKTEPVSSTTRLPKLNQSSKNQMNSATSFDANQSTGRLKRKPIPPQTGPHEVLDYKMLITDEINQLLKLNDHRQDKKRNLFQSSVHFM